LVYNRGPGDDGKGREKKKKNKRPRFILEETFFSRKKVGGQLGRGTKNGPANVFATAGSERV